MPASLTWSSGLAFSASPGRGGAGWKALGMGGSGSLGIVLELRGREPTRVEVLADPVERLARQARAREALELGVDRVARPDLDLAVADAGVEVIERAHRRAAGHLAAEAVDAAVARADEARRGLRPAHRAAEVHAAAGDRDERLGFLRRRVQLVVIRVARAHVDGRLADLADALDRGDHAREVVVVHEVVGRADGFPVDRRALEHGWADCQTQRRGGETGTPRT